MTMLRHQSIIVVNNNNKTNNTTTNNNNNKTNNSNSSNSYSRRTKKKKNFVIMPTSLFSRAVLLFTLLVAAATTTTAAAAAAPTSSPNCLDPPTRDALKLHIARSLATEDSYTFRDGFRKTRTLTTTTIMPLNLTESHCSTHETTRPKYRGKDNSLTSRSGLSHQTRWSCS